MPDDILAEVARDYIRSKKKSPYDDLFEDAGSRHDVDPDLLRAMTKQESTFNPKAESYKGAKGLMQLMPDTAKRFGVTDVNDPKQNVEGGTKYIKWLLDRYKGDVDKALAGYNAGEGAVDKYKGIPPYKETQNYVASIRKNYQGGGYKQVSDPVADSVSSYLKDVDPIDADIQAYLKTKPAQASDKPAILTPKGVPPLGQVGQPEEKPLFDPKQLQGTQLPPTNPTGVALQSGVPQQPPPQQSPVQTVGGTENVVPPTLPVASSAAPPTDQPEMPEATAVTPTDEDFKAANDYLASQKLPPITREEFDANQKTVGKSAQAETYQAQKIVPSSNPLIQQARERMAQKQTAPQTQGQLQQQTPQPILDAQGLTIETDVTGKTEDDIFDEMATKLSAQTGAPQSAVKAYLRKAGLKFTDDEHPVAKDYLEALAKNRVPLRTRISADDLAKIASAGQQYAQADEKLKATRAQLLEEEPKLNDSPEMLDVIAAQRAGLLGKNEGDKLLLQKRNDYIDWLTAKGYADEDAVKKAFGLDNPQANEPISALEWAWIRNPLHALFANRKDNIEKQVRGDIMADIQQYGSLAEATKEYKKQQANRKFSESSGLGFGAPSEALKTAARYVTSIPSTILETGAILTDASPVDVGYELATGESTGVKDALMNAAKGWRDLVDKDAALSQNPAYKEDFVVNELSQGLAQFAVQMIAAPLTGGASLAFPLAEGATAQFREANDAHAGRGVRLLAATVGAAMAAPDVVLKAKYLRQLSGATGLKFVENLTAGLFNKFSKAFGEEEARELTKLTLKSFLKTAATNGVVNVAGEHGQEQVEDIGNNIVNKLTYKPEMTWEEVFLPTAKQRRGYLAAGLSGLAGAGIETAIETMPDRELARSEEVLSQQLANQRITENDFKRIMNAVQTEIKTRQSRNEYFAKNQAIQTEVQQQVPVTEKSAEKVTPETASTPEGAFEPPVVPRETKTTAEQEAAIKQSSEEVAKNDYDSAVDAIPADAKGRGALVNLKEDIKSDDPIKALTAVHNAETRLDNMPDSPEAQGVRVQLQKIEAELEKQGYKRSLSLLGRKYNDGLMAEVTFEDDPTIPIGEERITRIVKPAIYKDGVVVRVPTIIVGKNYGTTVEPAKSSVSETPKTETQTSPTGETQKVEHAIFKDIDAHKGRGLEKMLAGKYDPASATRAVRINSNLKEIAKQLHEREDIDVKVNCEALGITS